MTMPNMKNVMRQCASALVLAFGVAACATNQFRFSVPSYAPPDGASATLINEIDADLKFPSEGANITLLRNACEVNKQQKVDEKTDIGTPFVMYGGKEAPVTPIQAQVPANRPMGIRLVIVRSYGTNDMVCRVQVAALLEEGKSYTLTGGAAQVKTDAFIIPNRPGCSLAIVDTQTRMPIPTTACK
jgi:hypothetical protein